MIGLGLRRAQPDPWGMTTQPRANRTTSAFDTWAAAHLGERHRREGVSNSAVVPPCLRPDYRAAWYGQPGEVEPAPAPRRPVSLLPLMVAASLGGVALCFASACGLL